MRRLNAKSDEYRMRGQYLSPAYGEIAVGGAHFDEILKAEVIASYLRVLRKGGTPDEALTQAQTDRTSYVQKFNRQRPKDYIVHCAETAEQALIESTHRAILRAVEEAS